jgi:peptide/nickel transport system permease protein
MWSTLRHNRSALFGTVTLLFFLLMAAVGPELIPMDNQMDFMHRFEPPEIGHWLGTDYAGRDILAQLVHGTRDIMAIAFSTALFSTTIALMVGIPAGLMGGSFDTIMTAITDVFLTVPSFPVMAILAALFRIRNAVEFGFILAVWAWPSLARAIRSQILTLKLKEFIEVCRVMAMGTRHIVVQELLPNIMPFVTINFIGQAKNAITASVGIMLLGLVPLRVENWGMMLNMAAFQTGALFVPHAWSYLLSPMLAIILFQYSLVNVAAGIDELFDPRLRGR